jgi:hypothetical protein
MNILVLGGSNAGLHFGWAAQLQELAPEHSITNRFLGAVGSLYGLMRLLEMQREKDPAPDLLIFEYALNDIVLLDAGCVRMSLLKDTLVQVVDFCERHKIRLLFLCLEVRPTGRARVYSCVTRVKKLYARVARAHAVCQCVTLESIFGTVRRDEFLDEHHLTEKASRRVAEYVVATIREKNITVPQASGLNHNPFNCILAREARTEGPCRFIEVQSTVFCGNFLEIARSGVSYWPGQGQLVGLMLRSTQDAGVFQIGVRNRAFRKNAQSKMREIVPKLILLHYSTRRPRADFDLEIAMPAHEAELMRLPNDHTLLDTPSEKPFCEQVLEINGVMLWRRASLLRRGLAALKTKLRSVAPGAAGFAPTTRAVTSNEIR